MDTARILTVGLHHGRQILTSLTQTAQEQAHKVREEVRDYRTRRGVTSLGSGVEPDLPLPLQERTHAPEDGEVLQTPPISEATITLTPQGWRTAVIVTSFDEANARLRAWSAVTPFEWACEYAVQFPEGTLAAGSIPLTPEADLQKHVRLNWAFLAGLDPCWATPQEYARILSAKERRNPGVTEHYRDLLKRHRL